MALLPTSAALTDVATTNAGQKANLAALRDFIADLLGTDSGDKQAARAALQIAPAQMRNLWDNSDWAINQRAATTAADGAYGFDRSYVLTETGSVTLGQLAQPTDGIPYAIRLTQPDAGVKRMGMAQAVEARSCLAYRGSQLVFAPKLRSSAGGVMRVALLAHTGAADTITRDVVNNWASGVFTPGNFFINTALSVIAVGSVNLAANTWTDVPVSSASAGGVVAPSTMNNLILVFWTDAQQAQNATLDVSLMRAGLGTSVPIWTPPDAQVELARCQRYYRQLVLDENNVPVIQGTNYTPTEFYGVLSLAGRMRATPTLVVSSGTHFTLYYNGAATAATAVTLGPASPSQVEIVATSSGLTSSAGAWLRSNNVNARLGLSAEL